MKDFQMFLIERLRGMVQKLRRTLMPIADVVPMLQEAADEIERLTTALNKYSEDDVLCSKDREIEVLTAENTALKKLLHVIAYPRRGTEEEQMDIFQAASLIQAAYTSEELE